MWQGERGFPQNTVTGIAQTPDGYLWLTTLDGVARFDGLRFKMFKAADTAALGSGRIRFLFTGRHGDLWLSTQEGAVVHVLNGRFEPLPLPNPLGVRVAVAQVAEDNQGALWVSYEDGTVGRLAGRQYSIVSTNWPAVARTGVMIRADAQGGLWALSSSGLYRVSASGVTPMLEGNPGQFSVHCPGRSGGWWVSAEGQVRLWCDGQWRACAGNPNVAADQITCGLEDHAGYLWLGTAADGLLRCETNGGVWQFTKRDGLSGNSVRTLFEDNEGDLWVGTENDGLDRLHLPFFTVYGPPQGLSSERVTTVSEGSGGELWVGTDGYGLNRVLGETAQPMGGDTPVATCRVAAVLADHLGRIWVGLRTGGVFCWQDGHFTEFGGFPTARVPMRSLFEDSHGAVWIGQRNTRALVRVKGENVSTIELPSSMPPADVRVMAEDAAGNFWFGTDGTGLLCWKGGQFTRFTRENGLSSDFVWALQPEPDGSLWIGTYGGGLTRLKNGHAVSCTTRHGLVDDVICYMADDRQGHYWFSSNQGVFRADKEALNQFADGKRPRIECVAYGRSDGLPALECEGGCQPAGCRSRDGRLWFATIRGLVVVNPAEASTNRLASPVHIESMVVDGEARTSETWGAGHTAEALPHNRQALPPALRIPPGKKTYDFRYTGLSFNAPERLRFRHKLEGVDAEWVDTGSQREASYDRLAPGNYVFRVQACNREGVWNEAGDALSFAVLPYFWQTGLFAASFLVFFGGAVGAVVGYALRRRHQRRMALLQRLNALERERTRIARDIHDDLGGSLTEIGYLGALAVRDSHSLDEAREQLGHIMERARDLARRLDETVWAVNPKNDSSGHLATYLCHAAREFLEPTGIRCRLDVAANLPDAPLTTEVRHNVYLVVKEALNNSVKHSGAKELSMRLTANDGLLTIEIFDDGCGFEGDSTRESGNGLRNMAARMAEAGGQFSLRTAPGQGTTICLTLPLQDDLREPYPNGGWRTPRQERK